MKSSLPLQPADAHGVWLREFDLRDLDATDPRSQWALKYRSRLQATLGLLWTCLPEGGRVFEVGCGQANASLLVAEQGPDWTALALDREPRALAYARLKYERGTFLPVCGMAEALPIASETLSAVLALEVLEHLADPPAALAEMRRVLRPGGLLVVTTPNADYHGERLPAYPQRSGEPSESVADAGGHLFAFTLRGLSGLLEECGFSLLAARYEGSVLMSNRFALKRLLPASSIVSLSGLLNRLPGAAALSYNCLVAARKS
jgi:SAM-dependent methyltransferase